MKKRAIIQITMPPNATPAEIKQYKKDFLDMMVELGKLTGETEKPKIIFEGKIK